MSAGKNPLHTGQIVLPTGGSDALMKLDDGTTIVDSAGNVVAPIDSALTSGQIFVGNASNVAGEVAMSGDIAISNTGVTTIQAGAVDNSMVEDSAGVGGLFVQKTAIVVYDFATDGGTAGPIPLTGSPTLPDNALVYVDSYEVQTTLTSATDASTVTLGVPTDGDFFTAIAISDASNPWDQGGAVSGQKALDLAAITPVKLTSARTLQVTVAGGENVTAGKIIFYLKYAVSD